jgi:hypothetical protein
MVSKISGWLVRILVTEVKNYGATDGTMNDGNIGDGKIWSSPSFSLQNY